MIKVQNIRKTFGALEVLKGIDLEISEGEIVSIVGASGAGKTTLLQIISTLEKPTTGNVMFGDQALEKLSPKKLARFRNENIGFIFQFHHLLPEFSAIENVCIPGFIGKKDVGEVERRAMELLDLLNVGHRANHKPSELSGGEQQRVAVARALINNPQVVFADEPSGNLDSHNAQQLHELFFKLRDDLGQTFVIVTHNNELADMADRKVVITDGSVENSQS